MNSNNTKDTNNLIKKINKDNIILIFLLVMLIILALFSITLGRYGIPFKTVYETIKDVLFGNLAIDSKEASVIFIIRIPRIIMAIIVGASLSVAGAAYQGMFKNPMVSPDLLGVAAGASVGACIGLLLSLNSVEVQILAFISGLLAVLLVMLISSAVSQTGSNNLLTLVLSGTVISSLCTAVTSLIKYIADTETKLPEITFWLMGSLAKTGAWKNVIILLIMFLIGAVPLYFLRWKINVMAFGEEEAQTMGIDTRKLRIIIIACSTLLTASSVATCGVIGWVGLVVPHISRFLVGPNYLKLLPCSMLMGGVFMLLVDTVARNLTAGEIPLGILTSIIGAPVFIYMLFKGRKAWS